mmetsp:Transcript_15446/g.32536  ORF Transcript_15446/g.32536 Transcript_15446/m.32536 type:complete len:317 (-) Transcript_15446:12-962(-)
MEARSKPGARTPIQQAAGMALQAPSPGASPQAGQAAPRLFAELDNLLGTGKNSEQARSVAVELKMALAGTRQCRRLAAALVADELPGEGRGRKLEGPQLFAELDGMLASPAQEEVQEKAAIRLDPCKKDLEELLSKVASDSGVLAQKFPVVFDPELSKPAPASPERGLDLASAEAQTEELTPPPVFEELAALIGDEESKSSEAVASLAALMSETLESHKRSHRAAVACQESDEEEKASPEHEEWRKNTLQALHGTRRPRGDTVAPATVAPAPGASGAGATEVGQAERRPAGAAARGGLPTQPAQRSPTRRATGGRR